jgi:hypothetical protein
MDMVPQASLAVGGSKVQPAPHSTILFAAQIITGGLVSTTLTVWLQVLALPQPSVALQILVALKVPPQEPL